MRPQCIPLRGYICKLMHKNLNDSDVWLIALLFVFIHRCCLDSPFTVPTSLSCLYTHVQYSVNKRDSPLSWHCTLKYIRQPLLGLRLHRTNTHHLLCEEVCVCVASSRVLYWLVSGDHTHYGRRWNEVAVWITANLLTNTHHAATIQWATAANDMYGGGGGGGDTK